MQLYERDSEGAAITPDTSVGSEIAIGSGRIRGNARTKDGVLNFRAIPYAQAPVGSLRWQSPQPAQRWSGVLDATRFGPRCPASRIPGYADDAAGESEDCLTLNVWTAATHSNERRPVMVWVHGGGFQFGSGAVATTDGTALARSGVIVVTFNYRLGVFGFFAHPELDTDGQPSGNYGLQDMIAVLRWVRDNIGFFGGDPDRVTIFGESAGAHAVGLLMVSPPAQKLFQRAIAQSGAWWDGEHGSLPTALEARDRGRRWVEAHAENSLASARSLPAAMLARRSEWNFLLDPVTTAFAPSIDHLVIPDTPAALFERGAQADVPLLAGWVAHEESVFMSRGLPTRPKAIRQAAERRFGADAVARHADVFPANRKQARQASDGITGALVIAEQVLTMVQSHARSASAGAWAYRFDHRSRFLPKAGHTMDVPFVFGALERQTQGVRQPPDQQDQAVSGDMMSRWIAFASNGDPGTDWRQHRQPDGGAVFRFGSAPEETDGIDVTRFMPLVASARRMGRLPDAWRQEAGRMPVAVAALVRRLLLIAVRFVKVF